MQLNALLASPVALPSIPKVLALLLSELDRPEPDLRKLTQLIATDPALTARVLQIANSSFFQLSRKIASPSEALAVLGMDHVRNLVTAACLGNAFRSVPGIQLNQFWRYSINVAKLSRSLAPLVKQNGGTAFTAGLIHAVGQLVMHLGMPEMMVSINRGSDPFSLRRARAEHRALGYTYGQVGAAFARQWMFPQPIVDALEHQDMPFENEAYEPLAGVMHLCAWRARALEADLGPKELATTFPGAVGLVLGLDIDMVLQQDPIDWTSGSEANAFA